MQDVNTVNGPQRQNTRPQGRDCPDLAFSHNYCIDVSGNNDTVENTMFMALCDGLKKVSH